MAVLILNGVEIEANIEIGLIVIDNESKRIEGGLLRDNAVVEVNDSYIIVHVDDESLIIPYHRLYELKYRLKEGGK
ncbi:MAG: hypothetical protein QXO37_09510 [Candidatus Nitrosocaldaceae archaeon]